MWRKCECCEPDEPEEPCATCGGERSFSVDLFTPGRGHFTIEEPCPDCTGDEYDDREPLELDSLERGLPSPPLASATSER